MIPLPGAHYNNIATIGCSNTRDAVSGYLDVSDQERLIRTAQSGVETRDWANLDEPWVLYDQERESSGYESVWLNICQTTQTGEPTANEVLLVVDRIWDRDPNIPIFISGLNYFETEECELTDGNYIPDVAAKLANMLVLTNDLFLRGPDLGPVPADFISDGCHFNRAGEEFVGQQLADFFDE